MIGCDPFREQADAYTRLSEECIAHAQEARLLASAFADAFDALDGDMWNLSRERFDELRAIRSVMLTAEDDER